MVDYTTASGYVTDDKGRRQYVDRSDSAGIQGTYLLASDRNQDRNAIMDPIGAAGLSGNADDDTLLTQAIKILAGQQAATVQDNLTAEAVTRANEDAKLQPLLGYLPVQQGGGVNQVAGKVFLGRDTTYPGLRYSYVNGEGNTVTGGYLLSTYGTELNPAYGQLGDLSQDSGDRLVYQSYDMNGSYSTAALLSDVTGEAAARAAADASLMAGFAGGISANGDKRVFGSHLDGGTGKVAMNWDGGQADIAFASDVTAEAAARAAADATLVSGTNSMDAGSGDMQIFSLHYSGGTSRPMVGYGPNGADQTYTAVAWYSDITGEAAVRAAADAQLVNGILAMGSTDYQCLGIHFDNAGRMMGVYENGAGGVYPTIALYTDVTNEAAARAAADANLMAGFVGGISASGDKRLYGGHLDGGSGKVAMSWDGGQADLAFASDVTGEAASRAAADAQLVSGTYGMGPGDVQILGIHTDNQGYVHVWDATGDKGMLEWHSTSDPSLKANMTPVTPDVLGDLNKIQMYSFDWKDGYVRKGHVPVGFSSKNLLEVWPDTVRTSKNNPDSIELLNLIAKQMAAIKQLKGIVSELQGDIAALKAGPTAARS